MLKFLVGCGSGNEETSLVACSEAADNAGSCNCSMANGYDVLEFGFEDTAQKISIELRCRRASSKAAVEGGADWRKICAPVKVL
jgi:hypothetical protein